MPQPPIAWKKSIALDNSSRTTACTRTSIDSRSGELSLNSRWSKYFSTPATPCSSTSMPPRICAAVRPIG